MTPWVDSLIARWGQKRQRAERQWEVRLDGTIYLTMPWRHFENDYGPWGSMQARILSRLRGYWPDSHVFFRAHTYLPEHYNEILSLCRYETIVTGKKDETVFLFPDCQDKELWAAFLGSAGLVPLARCLFIVDRDPADWRAAMSRLFEIAQGIAQGKSATEYEADMSVCHCLCYSLDEDLVIAKVALPERTVLSVLEGAAREEGLELVVRRKP